MNFENLFGTNRIKRFTNEIRRLRRKYSDWFLTALTVLLFLMTFVFSPLQAAGFHLFQAFAVAGLLAIIVGVMIISDNEIAILAMSIAFIANLSVFLLRLFDP